MTKDNSNLNAIVALVGDAINALNNGKIASVTIALMEISKYAEAIAKSDEDE